MKRAALIILIGMTLAFAFHQSILHMALRTYLAYTASHAGYELAYREIKTYPNEIVLTKPVLHFHKGGCYDAEEAHIRYAFHPLSKSLDLFIEFIEPKIALCEQGFDLKPFKESLSKGSSWFTINGQVQVSKGLVYFEDHPPLVFSLEQAWGEKEKLNLHLSHENAEAKLLYDGKEGTLQAHHVGADLLNHLIQIASPYGKDWVLSSGNLEGNLDFSFDEGIFARKEGELSLNNLAITHSSSGLETHFEEIHLSGNAPSDSHLFVQFAPQGTVELFLSEKELKNKKIDVKCASLGKEQYAFIEKFLTQLNPDWSFLECVKGSVDAHVTVDLQEANDTFLTPFVDVTIHHIQANDLLVRVTPWQLTLGAKELSGKFNFTLLSEEGWKNKLVQSSLEGKLHVVNGEIFSEQFDGVDFKNIQTDLLVKEGDIQPTTATLEIAGLKGKALWKEKNRPELLHMTLEGSVKDLLPFTEGRIKKGLELALLEDSLYLNASLSKGREGLEILGDLEIKSKTGMNSPPLSFGFTLMESGNAIPAPPKQLLSYLPLSLISSQKFQLDLLEREYGYSGFTLRDGWLKVEKIASEKFLAPFLFPHKEMKAKGLMDISGSFDLTALNISYQASHLILENEALVIEVPKFTGATHLVEFETSDHYGFIPIEHGSYFDKGSGLLFTDISSSVFFKGDKIDIQDVTAFSNGIYVMGAVEIDYSPPEKGAYNVNIYAHDIEGTFVQAQHVLSHFEKTKELTEIPLDGKLNFGPDGGHLYFGVRPEEDLFQARFDWQLSDGKMAAPNLDLSVHELNFHLVYDFQENRLKVDDLQGIVLLGKDLQVSEYSLHSNGITFKDFKNNVGTFDFALKDEKEDFIRLTGETKSSDLNSKLIEVVFDKAHTHVGNLYPKKLSLFLNDWKRVDKFAFATEVRLSSLVHDLQNLSLFISKEMLQDLNRLNTLGGEIDLSLGFEGAEGTFDFSIHGSDLVLDNYSIKDLTLRGLKRQNKWSIEELNFGPFSFSAEFAKESDLWKVDFLGIQFADALLMGVSGSYKYGDPKVSAKVNLLEMNLSKLGQWDELKPLLEELDPQGVLKGFGDLTLTKTDLKGWELETNLTTSLKEVVVQGFAFEDGENIAFHLSSDKGWTLGNFNSGLRFNSGPDNANFNLEELQYEFASQGLLLKNLAFHIDAERLPWLSSTLHQKLPETVTEEIASILGNLKQEGSLEGNLSLQFFPSDKKLQLQLKDGTYHLFNNTYDLKHFSLNVDQEEVLIHSLYSLNKQPIWISARYNLLDPDHGTFFLTDTTLEDQPPLEIIWKDDPSQGLVFEKIHGSLAGLTLDLQENPTNPTTPFALHLNGTVYLDGQKSKNLFPDSIAEMFDALKLGSGYTVKGDFEFSKESVGENRDVRFFGTLFGQDLELKGYKFKNLTSQVVLEPSSFQLFDLTLSDLAGTLHINNLRADKTQDVWTMSIPLVSVYDFKPSLLYDLTEPPPKKRKPLIVRQLFLQDFQGVLGDINSFKGYGTLYFNNPQKKHLQNTIFAIPAEILTRIGLNLSVLTPVSGNIDFQLSSGKIYLTDFKDVYSDGKISKFYLTSSDYNSTIDYDGNLDVQLKFKQSTLLLKLAEFFTIQVKGTLKKPSYSLQRQKYLIKKEEIFATSEEHLTP